MSCRFTSSLPFFLIDSDLGLALISLLVPIWNTTFKPIPSLHTFIELLCIWDDSYLLRLASSFSHSLSSVYSLVFSRADVVISGAVQATAHAGQIYIARHRTTRISLLFPQTTAWVKFSRAVGFVWVVGPPHFLKQRLWIRLAWQGPQLLTLIKQRIYAEMYFVMPTTSQWVFPRNSSWITSAIIPFPYLQDAWKGQKFSNFPVSKVLWR
jgi:hypothetical protein